MSNTDTKKRTAMTMREYKVVKSNDLIQNARFNFTASEQKAIHFIVSTIKPSDIELTEMIFSTRDFCNVCGIDDDNGGNYRHVKKVLQSLRDKSVWVVLPNGVETPISWINKVYFDRLEGSIRLRIDEDMKPFLMQLKEKFTQFDLLYTLAMKSRYSIRVYELLKSYEWKHKHEFSLDELKRKLGAENYERWADFKRYVLDIAMREIDEFSDLQVTYNLKKTGKKYTSIVFLIREKTEKVESWVNAVQRLDSGGRKEHTSC